MKRVVERFVMERCSRWRDSCGEIRYLVLFKDISCGMIPPVERLVTLRDSFSGFGS